jgi:hypothetical protein
MERKIGRGIGKKKNSCLCRVLVLYFFCVISQVYIVNVCFRSVYVGFLLPVSRDFVCVMCYGMCACDF